MKEQARSVVSCTPGDAERAIACYYACVGIPNPAGIGDALEAFRDLVQAVDQEHRTPGILALKTKVARAALRKLEQA